MVETHPAQCFFMLPDLLLELLDGPIQITCIQIIGGDGTRILVHDGRKGYGLLRPALAIVTVTIRATSQSQPVLYGKLPGVGVAT